MKRQKTTAPVQGGTATKMTATALAEKAIRELGNDQDALRLVAHLVEMLAARSLVRRRQD